MSTRVSVFGESIPVTTTGGVRAPTMKKLLRTRSDLICRLTSAFESMTDGFDRRDDIVTHEWVIEHLVERTKTLRIGFGRRLGCDIIFASTASYSVDIYDSEVVRRGELIASLPHHDLPADTPTTLAYSNGRPVLWGHISTARTRYLESMPDGIAFDEGVTNLLAMTDIEQLAVSLQTSHFFPDFTRYSPTI